jgi:hypothetical protein
MGGFYMNILVKRYRVRRNGKKYKAGDIVEGVPAAEAEKLVKESHGSLQLLRFKDNEAAGAENNQEEMDGLPDTIPAVTHRKGGKK